MRWLALVLVLLSLLPRLALAPTRAEVEPRGEVRLAARGAVPPPEGRLVDAGGTEGGRPGRTHELGCAVAVAWCARDGEAAPSPGGPADARGAYDVRYARWRWVCDADGEVVAGVIQGAKYACDGGGGRTWAWTCIYDGLRRRIGEAFVCVYVYDEALPPLRSCGGGPFPLRSVRPVGTCYRYDRYTGLAQREMDAESGLQYTRARHYDPSLGRFVQRDPLQSSESVSPYLYGDDDPIRYTDPSGEWLKGDWQRQARDQAGIDKYDWKPYLGLAHNRNNLLKTYAWYRKTFYKNQKQFLWAGLAYLAGTQVVPALDELDSWVHAAGGAVWLAEGSSLQGTVGAVAGKLESMEVQLLWINKDIFEDLAWQHLAYMTGGIREMRTRYKGGELDAESLDAWEDINGTGHGSVLTGNLELVRREQEIVAQPHYDRILLMMQERSSSGLGIPWNSLMGGKATNPIPHQPSFAAAFPEGTLASFADRWKWINDFIYVPWAYGMSPAERLKLVQETDIK